MKLWFNGGCFFWENLITMIGLQISINDRSKGYEGVKGLMEVFVKKKTDVARYVSLFKAIQCLSFIVR